MNNKEKIHQLLKGIKTGDSAVVSVVDEAKYIQHNPQTHEGSEGLAALFKHLTKTSPKVNIVRIFEDGDFVLSISEGYSNQIPFSFFELYRLNNGKIVEHWDTSEVIPSKDKWKNNNGKF